MLDEIESSQVTSVNLDQLAKIYLKIRDAKDELTSQYKDKVAGLQEQLDTIEQEINEVCKQMNASSIRTSHGTIIRSV